MLSVEHVTKTYGKFTALEDISLTFTPGVYGLLAPNGAGKTTLIKMLTTLLFPTKGQILWEGEDIRALGAEYRGLLGYLPQQFGYYPSYTPRQFLRYAAALQCIPKREADGRIDHLLETVGLGDAADKKMKKFSGGMLQRSSCGCGPGSGTQLRQILRPGRRSASPDGPWPSGRGPQQWARTWPHTCRRSHRRSP